MAVNVSSGRCKRSNNVNASDFYRRGVITFPTHFWSFAQSWQTYCL